MSLGQIKSETVISLEEMDEYQRKKYLLTTITPLVKGPKKTVREVTQADLYDILEGYGEVAEFIVGLEAIEH